MVYEQLTTAEISMMTFYQGNVPCEKHSESWGLFSGGSLKKTSPHETQAPFEKSIGRKK